MKTSISNPPGSEVAHKKSSTESTACDAASLSVVERSRLRKRLMRGHQIVLTSLEVANVSLRRVTTVTETAERLLPKEVRWLGKNYEKELSSLISSILESLIKKGLVFSPGRLGKHRYYGATGILDPERSTLPDSLSRRRRVLGIVYRAVEHFGRAVRTGDVLEFVCGMDEPGGISPELITRDMMNLAETGELALVATVRGDEKGANLYLPSDLNPEPFLPTEPLTWLEDVARSFTDLWNEELNHATDEGRKARPLSTGAVRTKVGEATSWPANLEDPRLLPNALLQLAHPDNALIRKVERKGQQSLMWAPVGVIDESLDLGDAYVSDAERVSMAVERGCRRLGRPVNIRDVRDEIEMDPALQPAGKSPLRSIVSDVSKQTIDAGNGNRRDRVNCHYIHVGKVNGDSYYHHDAATGDEARSYVRFRQLELRWSETAESAAHSDYRACMLPSVAIGRAMLVRAEVERLINDLDELLQERAVDQATRREAQSLRERVAEVIGTASEWLARQDTACLNIPRKVSTSITGWTAAELLQAFKPLYPAAKKLDSPNRLTTMIGRKIRRFPNPEFKSRFSKDPHKASEFLFDRADALLFAAARWGSYECCMQAMLIRSEIGALRDPRFIYPAFSSPSFEERLRAIACLAYVQSELGNELLRDASLNDREPGLRQSALWAYGFSGGEGSNELLAQRAKEDPDGRVRAFCQGALESLTKNEGLWWKI